ncbi:MAG: bifunctional riboflavin kinase/FAD synthetase [Phycisphaerae bacterium]
MRVFHGVSSVDLSLKGAVLSVGNFDGVHLGHQRILRTARARARVSNTAVIAMTFEPHPLALLNPSQAPAQLTSWDEKVSQLERAGADAVVRLETDWPLLSLPAEDFVREIVVKRIHPTVIVEGPNFGFGRGRQGNVETLRRCAEKGGYELHVVESCLVRLGEDPQPTIISSTVVRQCLTAGEVSKGAACLGRPYTLIGQVVRGAGAGKKLGFPTINLEVGSQLVPAEGVYAGVSEISGTRRAAAVSIGCRPTLGGSVRVIEAFLLDESGDFYDRKARLELWDHLRPQKRFESRAVLTEQITRDVEEVRRITAGRI